LSEHGDYEITFEAVEKSGRGTGSSSVAITGSGGPSSDADAEVSVTRPVLTPESRRKASTAKKSRRIEMTMTIRDRRGTEIWQSDAKVDFRGDDKSAVWDRLARTLANWLGQTGSGPLLD